MGATGKPDLMGSRSRRGRHGALPVVLLWGLLLAACSDNKGPAGPTAGAGQVGHADTTSQLQVDIALNPTAVEVNRRIGVTVLVTNQNGRPLAGRHVQLSLAQAGAPAARLDRVDGDTDAGGKFVSFILCIGPGDGTVTAFVEGAEADAEFTCGSSTETTTTTTTTTTGTGTGSGS